MQSENTLLPFALPDIGDREIRAVVETMRTGWLTTGKNCQEFERDFSEFIGDGVRALAVNSATAGLHLALDAIKIKQGDKVITTPYTFTATAEVIRYVGADPLFVDIEADTFNIDPSLIPNPDEIEGYARAILPVHFAGQACEMEQILSIARKYDWYVVEDAAHALPTTYKGHMVGTLSDITVYSFYATKTIATGEGGMIVSKNEDLIKRARVMRLHGISRDAFDRYTVDKPSWFYEIVAPGYKYNMTDIAAAIGIQQLKRAWDFQRRRQFIAKCYDEAFSDLPLRIPIEKHPNDTHAWHLYVIQLELDQLRINRDRFIELMFEAGIATSVHFIPLHIQPYWRDRYNFNPEDFPVAYDVYQRAVSLPIYPKMTDGDVERVIAAVRAILKRFEK